MKLILIDDNADFAETMRYLLQIRGYEVQCHFNGHDFLRRVSTVADDDVIITDYYLPDLNGVELVRRARAERPGVMAILLTGSREDGIEKDARQLADCELAFKPVDCQSLEKTIQRLEKKRARL